MLKRPERREQHNRRVSESHAWFIGFAPVGEPKIAISVLVENAGSGSKNAVPIAEKVFAAYFNK